MSDNSAIPSIKGSSIFYSLGSITLCIIGLLHFEEIFKPLVIAFLIWFIINELKIYIGKIKIGGFSLPPKACGLMSILLIVSVIFLAGRLVMKNVEGIALAMPGYITNFDQLIANMSALVKDPLYSEYINKTVSNINFGKLVTGLINSISGMFANSLIVVIYVVFFFLENAYQKLKIEKLFPGKGDAYDKFIDNIERMGDAVSSYLWSKTLISIITGVVSYILLYVQNVEYAFLWAFLIFILNFIPYLGPLISSLLPAIFAVVITGDPMKFVYVLGSMVVVQLILGNFVEPIMMGKGTNIGPLTVVVALAFWGMIWGVVGLMLAVPITAVMVIVLSQIKTTRYIAIMLSEKGIIPD